MDRRSAIALMLSAVAAAPALALDQSRPTASAFGFEALDGGRINLAAYAGKPVLVVNTASRCGYSGQLADLAQLWTRFHDRGLMIVAVPSNDFNQEPGDAAEIRAVCSGTHGGAYPITAKQSVKGAEAHPFFRWAALASKDGGPRWNFHKYLVGADGGIAASFPSGTRPIEPQVIAAIERQLSAHATQ